MNATKTKQKRISIGEFTRQKLIEVGDGPKSPMLLFREKYPNGYAGGCEIINMRAVLK
jgi:hypothetical protein